MANAMIENVFKGDWNWIRPLEGMRQMRKLAQRISRKQEGKLTFDANDIAHTVDIVRLSSKTVQKCMSGGMRETSLIRRAVKSREKMQEAAKLELYMGNVKRYCELMFAAGEFDLAIAAAPAVSVRFWSEMVKNRAKLYDDANDIANCYLVNSQVDEAVSVLLNSGMGDKAFLCAAARS
jgi:hypothetical protein